MKSSCFARLSAAGLLLSIGMAGAASAAEVRISITNEQPTGGLFLTPLVSVFHDGSGDPFNAGEMASAGVALIAEEGSPADLIAEGLGQVEVLGNPDGFPNAPVIDTGETASGVFDVDGSGDLYWSYLSMVISSNDFFIGNDDPIKIFEGGVFQETVFEIYTDDVWDAGSEVNSDGDFGKAFNPNGGPPGTGDDENDVVTLAGDELFDLEGVNTPVGALVVPAERRLLATVSITQNIDPIPAPAALPLLLAGLAGFGLLRRRQRQS